MSEFVRACMRFMQVCMRACVRACVRACEAVRCCALLCYAVRSRSHSCTYLAVLPLGGGTPLNFFDYLHQKKDIIQNKLISWAGKFAIRPSNAAEICPSPPAHFSLNCRNSSL